MVKHWAHDWAGWLMMPLALVLVGLELGILSWLVPKETADDQFVSPLLIVTKKDTGKSNQAIAGKVPGKQKKNQDRGGI